MKVKYNPEITLTTAERQNIKDIVEYLDNHEICRQIDCGCINDCSPETCPFHSIDDDMKTLEVKLRRILDTTKEE
jgi:hypothetical protein